MCVCEREEDVVDDGYNYRQMYGWLEMCPTSTPTWDSASRARSSTTGRYPWGRVWEGGEEGVYGEDVVDDRWMDGWMD